MIRKILAPIGWPCRLSEAPPGHFIPVDNIDQLCFKSEYHHDDGRVIAYNDAGEFYCTPDKMVQPVEMETEEYEE